MSTAMHNSQPTRISATDPNLAFLASRAAIQLDRMIQGKSTSNEAVRELAGQLKSATFHVAQEEPAALWDPSTVSLLRNAIDAKGTSPVTTIDELIGAATKIAQQLETTTDQSKNTTDIERLRSFCVGLSNSAIAHERSQIETSFEKPQWSS
jgi:hypothetical protein